MGALHWKIGVEVELLAPLGRSREDLARALAQTWGGTVRRVFHQDSEPSKVPGHPIFYNLTLGFDVLDPRGQVAARCVDDLTLQDDLDRKASPKAGWWRVVSDDERLLRLIALHADPARGPEEALSPLVGLFNGSLIGAAGGMFRLIDSVGAPLAIAAPLPGERERPCELISAPLTHQHEAQLETLLATARALGFLIPKEGATHIHFDAEPLCDAHTLANLVNVLWAWGGRLRTLCGTPASFRRVGGWPEVLRARVGAPGFRALPWPAAREQLAQLNPSKYCDFNLKNIATGRADRHTFEVRIFPATLDAAEVIAGAALFEGLLGRCQQREVIAYQPPNPWRTEDMLAFLATLPLDEEAARWWRARALAAPS